MPTRIRIPQLIIPRVPIPVKPTRTARLRHNRIGTDEAAKDGGVVAGVVVVKAEAGLLSLGGEAEVGRCAAAAPAFLAVGQVARFGDDFAVFAGC
jgi:hypothetical protein